MTIIIRTGFRTVAATLVFAAGVGQPAWAAPLDVAQAPLYLATAEPPLNMLVMGKDHKNYYEAYNDAADLNGDGTVDVGYKPDEIDYYGYFNSKVCYRWSQGDDRFEPAVVATGSNGKQCAGAGHWSGDFLNYVTTGRFDALRKVLYGGWRQQDTATETTLQGAFFPQDGHTWAKEFASEARDGYDIADYTPLSTPGDGRYHLFAVTTLADGAAPKFRVMENSRFRVWNWASIEGPVADNTCFNDSNQPVACVDNAPTAGWEVVPASRLQGLTQRHWRKASDGSDGNPTTAATFADLFALRARSSRLCGSGTATQINGSGNRFAGTNSCTNDNYLTQFDGQINITVAGDYQFAVDGDDGVEVQIGTTIVAAWYGGHDDCGYPDTVCTTHQGTINLAAGTYNIRFRHEEGGGGDSYRLNWRPALPPSVETTLSNYTVRVSVCPNDEALRESTCKAYGSGNALVYKPTGILHDFGETERMYFGLLTGSQFNNLRGGVLRRNISSFAQEVNPDTGQFRTNVDGIVRSLDRLRMIGGGYGGKTRSRDTSGNWSWNNGTGNCDAGAIGGDPLQNGQCRMWGNPVGEMMLETLRYFAGGAATARYTGDGATQGTTEETTLGLTTAAWRDPYKPVNQQGLGFKACAKPVMTVISDINPSYDSDVPGNPWSNTDIPALPASLSTFSLDTVGSAMWQAEFGAGSRNVYIGQSGVAASNGAPTLKSASSFGDIRGLSPEEPTKRGSYSSAAVASYGWSKDGPINPLSSEKVRTYAVALASPLPRIEFPVDGKQVTFVPFAKTASGTFGTGTNKPTNTIVDFYIEQYINLPGQPSNAEINEGRPYAVFRINYEDVEQGNDHDMDAIVRYEVIANANNTITVNLQSEYAAGSANQNMGYIVTGTTKDGVYLEVRDTDSPTCQANVDGCSGNGWRPYALNTPPNRDPGYCASSSTQECGLLPLSATRNFTPSAQASEVTVLRDPLWYAAKFGGFTDNNDNGIPDGHEDDPADERREWDADGDGVPDKYFLVTNALTLREQLARAFSQIEADSKPAAGVAASGTRRDVGFLAYIPAYTSQNWTGELSAHFLQSDGSIGIKVWSALERMPAPNDRKMFVVTPGDSGDLEMEALQADSLGEDEAEQEVALGFNPGELASDFDATIDDAIDFFRGVRDNEQAEGGRFRDRLFKLSEADSVHSPLGDILNSQPEVLSRGSQGYGGLPEDKGGGGADVEAAGGAYGDFVRGVKSTRTSVLFVGANDGALHAFNGDFGLEGGKELFAVIPRSSLGRMAKLARPGYSHEYFMDAPPTQGDAYFSPGGSGAREWRTVLLAGNGAGGRSLLALDVTDPVTSFDEENFLWEFSDPDLGLTTSRAQVFLMQDGNWYAAIGNGVNSDAERAYLYLIRLDDPSIFYKLPAGDATGNGLMSLVGVDVLGYDEDNDSDPIALPDLHADVIYAADYLGNVWKYDVSSQDPTNWQAAGLLFSARDRTGEVQNITGGLNVTTHPSHGNMVYFGTGRYFLEGDNETPANPQVQSFYGVWDNAQDVDPATVDTISGRDELVQQSITAEISAADFVGRQITDEPVDYASARGWYLDLLVDDATPVAEGERFIGEPRVELGRVIFPTFTPQGDECSPGGINWLYGLSAVSGSPELTFVDPEGRPDDECPNCGGIRLTPPGQSTPPAIAPPIVADPGTDPGLDCIPGVTPDCVIPPPSCVPGIGECPLPSDGSAIPGRACTLNLGVLLAEGLRTFSTVSCGRQSWRQIR